MSERSAGRAVVELLKAEQVRYIFGIVGSTFLDVLDALYDDRSVEYINVRHEQAAAFMADGLARVTDVPGVCLVTSGPGATNLLTGVAAAHVAHSPVVVLVGGVDLDHYRKDAFQDFDLVSMFRPVTKLAIQIPSPGRIPELLRAALRAAMTGRRGPVFVEIPRNVLNDQTLPGGELAPGGYRVTHPLPPHPDAIAEAARLLRQAERPLLLVGGGVTRADANALVVRLSEQHAIPMITAYGRNDAVPNGHPLYIGPLGRAGSPEAAAACRRADLLLVMGSRLAHFTTHFDHRHIRPETAIIQIDVESRDIGRYYATSIGIQADAREACRALLDTLGRDGVGSARQAWRHEAEALRAQREARLAAEAGFQATPLKPQRVYAELRRALPPETIVALDAGAAPAYGYDRLHFSRPRTFLTPLDLGGLGFAFPEALGAKLGRPDAPVLAIHGDGGFLMNAQEIETAVRHGINVVTLVMNNNCWGSEKAYQKHFYGGRYIGCDLGNPRYDQFARLFGAEGYYVEHPDQIGDAITAALRSGKPTIVEVPIDPEEFPTPATAVRGEKATPQVP
ncbi:MAG TPA: thiamine pyrophosphate-binding protein [Methylomirabilota bacterium]|jgi:acetolactate synthase-1/2/3 large subunit/sulfoacetaldehyde acetyltransferase|nr:thiamine pyrophosphate-binding protein [Methylomirabilota bacterium]